MNGLIKDKRHNQIKSDIISGEPAVIKCAFESIDRKTLNIYYYFGNMVIVLNYLSTLWFHDKRYHF